MGPASHRYVGGATSRPPTPSPSPRPSPTPAPRPSPSASIASKLSTCRALKAGMSQKCNSNSYKGSAVQPAMLRFPCGRSGKARCPFSSGGNDRSRACSGGPCWKCLAKSAVDKFYTDNCAGLSASTAATASSASSASSTGYKDVGEGYCPQFKELTKGKTQSECFDMVQADSACKNKDATSYGKGKRAKRCLCDTIANCRIGGTHLKNDGFDRIQRLSNSAPAGYNAAGNNCNCDGTRLAQYGTGKATLALCANACSAKSDCKSFGLWTGHAKGNCVLWKKPCTGTCSSPAYGTNTRGGWTNDVYNKGSASTASPASSAPSASSASSASSTGYKHVGEGYCPQFKELTKGKTQAGCLDIVQDDPACTNKDTASYGKGARATRCLCDKSANCRIGGRHLKNDGFDRIQRLSSSASSPSSTSNPKGSWKDYEDQYCSGRKTSAKRVTRSKLDANGCKREALSKILSGECGNIIEYTGDQSLLLLHVLRPVRSLGQRLECLPLADLDQQPDREGTGDEWPRKGSVVVVVAFDACKVLASYLHVELPFPGGAEGFASRT